MLELNEIAEAMREAGRSEEDIARTIDAIVDMAKGPCGAQGKEAMAHRAATYRSIAAILETPPRDLSKQC